PLQRPPTPTRRSSDLRSGPCPRNKWPHRCAFPDRRHGLLLQPEEPVMEFAFYFSSGVAVVSTLRVVTGSNPVHALLYLVISLLADRKSTRLNSSHVKI